MIKHNGPYAKLLTFDGQSKSVPEWADVVGITIKALRHRLKHWPMEKALTIAKDAHNPRKRGRSYGFDEPVGGGASNTFEDR
jgi:hypothetical protein